MIIVGGEPLLREDLPDVMAVLTGRAYSTVFTNGMLLAERTELMRNANSVFISLDAPDEEHDKLRAKKGCFERAVNGIEVLRSRYPKIAPAIMTTVTDANAHRVRDMIACTTTKVIGNINNTHVKQFLDGHDFKRNADAGPTCPTGCRDWGIHDISAVHNRTHSVGDFQRLARGFLIRN